MDETILVGILDKLNMSESGQSSETDTPCFGELVATFQDELAQKTAKYKVLQNLDLFVLDNSIRESTVAQLRGHTIESKWEIYNEVKKMGFTDVIVASFSHMTRVDDVFIKQLVEKGEDRSGLFAFSEITEGTRNGIPDTETLPIGLSKLKEVGLYNAILEIDLGDSVYDFNKFPMSKMLAHLEKLIKWCHDNLHPEAKVLLNFRDLPEAMSCHPERVFQTVQFVANLSDEIRLFGLIYEDPSGKSLPEEIGTYTQFIRKIMDDNKWKGHLLVHVHEKFGYSDTTALESLMCGANGIWASICIEGAAMGHASSCITLMNLIRLGNRKVIEKYNCQYLRQAAVNVTKITTGKDPYTKQPIYGERALDFVFDLNPEEFDLAEFFGEKPTVRITTLASNELIQTRLVNLFGEDPHFTQDQAYKMKEIMLDDLKNNRKEEYMSPAGLAVLFDRAGGSLTETMRDVIVEMKSNSVHADRLISEVRAIWDTWDAREEEQFRGDDMLKYDSFYNGFMAPYFACYRCSDTKKALKAIDMDADNQVDWSEFLVYLKWALHQYPMIKDTQELLDITFRKGIIPAMHDEIVTKKKMHDEEVPKKKVKTN